MRSFLLGFMIVVVFSCKSETKELTAQEIVDTSIQTSGSDKIQKSKITFQFRDKKYEAFRDNGTFNLSRSFKNIKDILSNKGFERFISDELVSVPDSMATKYASSINSVHYFSVLPYGLNDKAVKKKLLKEVTLQKKEYYKVEVTFNEEGGGEDFEDVFVYWINKKTFLIDYMAYSFHVNGGGMRFRAAKNQREINGVYFIDYNNYKPTDSLIKLENLDRAYINNELKKISEVNLEAVNVFIID